MKLLYSEEHLRCINYDQGDNPVIEIISLRDNEQWDNFPIGNKLIFIIEGEITFSFGKYIDCRIEKKKIIYLPTGYKFTCKALERCTLMTMRIQGLTCFCDDYHYKDLERNISSMPDVSTFSNTIPATLDINEVMEKYIDILMQYIGSGAKCKSFYVIKIKELFYIFRWYYTKKDLYNFFHCSLKGGSEFASCIMETWDKYKSVGELAKAMNYTVSGFEKRFKRVFGISPYRWMMNQKAERVFHQVRTTNLTFKQISADFGFTSLSHFNDFCKTNFGKPPGNIRENSISGGNHE